MESYIAKGKRTKRTRPESPFHTSTSSTCTVTTEDCCSIPVETVTQEEEELANCLILLARGVSRHKFSGRRLIKSTGSYVYDCKTCNRSFPSFQALGGHRASHKNPKANNSNSNSNSNSSKEEGVGVGIQATGCRSGNLKGRDRVHECSICGSEFSSGQALGGHMRRHRVSHKEEVKQVFGLDLNLPPAPDQEIGSSKFQHVFTGPALVGCHY